MKKEAMLMIKMIFSDIDGTFLCDDRHVSPRTAATVKEIIARGVRFALVSARMPEAIYPLTHSIGLDIPLISYSGAYVLDEQGATLASITMEAAATRRLLQELATDTSLTLNYYAGHHWYVTDASQPRVRMEIDITQARPQVLPQGFATRLDAGELPNKILIMAEPAACERLERELADAYPMFHVVRSAPFLLEIMDRTVSKATGLAVLLDHYGLTRQESLSFGDNYNDLEMLAYTGISVAMGNAPDAIKKAATHQTAPNTADGLARFLEENRELWQK